MRTSFVLILILVTACLVGWTLIHYQFQESRQHQLNQLPEIPVYVYVADSTSVDQLQHDLRQIPQLKSLVFAPGKSVARQSVVGHGLDITEGTLAGYRFPDTMTLTFNPVEASLEGRTKALSILGKYGVPAAEIDNQSEAWLKIRDELKYLRGRWSSFTIFTALILFLLFAFARINLFLRDSLEHKGIKTDFFTAIRKRKERFWQSLLLVIVPLAVNLAVYFWMVYFQQKPPLVDWQFFAVQAGTLLASAIVAYIRINMKVQKPVFDLNLFMGTPQ